MTDRVWIWDGASGGLDWTGLGWSACTRSPSTAPRAKNIFLLHVLVIGCWPCTILLDIPLEAQKCKSLIIYLIFGVAEQCH